MGCRAGYHLVCRYMNGVFKLTPSMSHYKETWDVGIVLKKSKSMSLSQKFYLKDLALKHVMLMALSEGARIELHLLLLDETFCKNFEYTFRENIPKNIKNVFFLLISLVKPHKVVSRSTIEYWNRTMTTILLIPPGLHTVWTFAHSMIEPLYL